MSISRKQFSPELKAIIRAEYESSNISLKKLAGNYGLAAMTVTQWARRDGWRRDYTANLPSTGQSLAVIEHLRANPEASAGELVMVAHRDVSDRRIQCETNTENTARAIHSLMNNALKERDGVTLGVLTAAAKGLEAVAKVQREALGMVPGVCYRTLTKE
ncbi:hypothetical protein EDF88_5002 [Buttiauxella sp. BIGb0552]|uniref:hypothetical protein n=1 Tax=Buttiauxella sp. BIGb0552 TaxID=2485120 RepID=UPI001065688D|nr:hypothetical protein [Buttiauxella sp. BIGb0552]TDX09587.1 hypothetical protein EDF88_5002 [Buttiauxella sp. BIGb0552]